MTSLDGINGWPTQTLLRGENYSKQSNEFQATDKAVSRQKQDEKGKKTIEKQKEKWGEEWWKNRKTSKNVENTGKEGESGENIGKQGESGKNTEKHVKTEKIRERHRKTRENRANQGKTEKHGKTGKT